MKTKKTTTRPTMTLARGVGFDATRLTSGYGLKNEPAVVLAIHPVYGTRVHGPFVDIDAATLWAVTEGAETVASMYGTSDRWALHPVSVEVPATYHS